MRKGRGMRRGERGWGEKGDKGAALSVLRLQTDLHHLIDIPHGVDEIGGVLVKLALDEKLDEIANEGRVNGAPFPVFRPHFRRFLVSFVLEQLLVEKLCRCLRHLTQGRYGNGYFDGISSCDNEKFPSK